MATGYQNLSQYKYLGNSKSFSAGNVVYDETISLIFIKTYVIR